MLKRLKIYLVHLWAVMLFMSKTSKIANIFRIYTVEKPWISAFQNFFQIENPLNIKEVMSKNMFVYILSFF